MNGILIFVLLLAPVFAGCATTDDPTPGPTPEEGGDDVRPLRPVHFAAPECSEVYADVPVEAAAVRGRVPARFHILGEEAGIADFVVAFVWCTEATLDGEPIGETGFVEAGVRIADPEGGAGLHIASLWHHYEDADLMAAVASLSLPAAGLVRLEGAFAGNPAAPAGLVQGAATAESNAGIDALSATAGGPARLQNGNTNWWSEGEAGVVRLSYDLGTVNLWQGTGTLTAGPGTALAELVGAGERTVTAGLVSFTEFRMTVEVVTAPARAAWS